VLNYFGFVAWPSQRINFIPHECLADFIFSRAWSFLLILALESGGWRFEHWIWAWNLKNFYIFSFTRNDYFLSIGFDIDVVGADARSFSFVLTEGSKFGFHTSERNEGFGEFTLFGCKWFIWARTGNGLFSSISFTLSSKHKGHQY
jgi:hypothetical protein